MKNCTTEIRDKNLSLLKLPSLPSSALSLLFLYNRRYLGDSGVMGSRRSCNPAGTSTKPAEWINNQTVHAIIYIIKLPIYYLRVSSYGMIAIALALMLMKETNLVHSPSQR